jgi:hypothetical protein
MFAPKIKTQRVFHFTHRRHAIRATRTFDPAKPTSLLYKKDASGEFRLVGAMYTASGRASMDDLDERVPLGIARWHLHTNICVPKLRDRDRWTETVDGRMKFGPAGAIVTREQCDAAGGRFFPQALGWMVHVNAMADDPSAVWHDEHAMHEEAMRR